MTDALVGDYIVSIEMNSTNQEQNSTSIYYFKISILSSNTPPRFVNDITSLLYTRIIQSEEVSELTLGPVTDDQDHYVLTIFEADANSTDFITFDYDRMMI